MTQTAVVICPGRGTYNKSELGFLARHHAEGSGVIAQFDEIRRANGQTAVSELDAATRFFADVHTRGDNASPLIYTASYLDALTIRDHFDVVAVTGNSMGWYTALAVAGAVSPAAGFQIVNTMGRLMQESLIGGQSIYPFVDETWQDVPGQRETLLHLVERIDRQAGCDLGLSIDLGGMLVVAGNAAGLDAFEAEVPAVQGRFPLRLPNHAAFHTRLQAPVAAQGREILGGNLFGVPEIPMIDGRGVIWNPYSCTPDDLRAYTLGHQVVETYDFTTAIRVAARSFAPDVFVVTGPGDTLGGAVAQSLIRIGWKGLESKSSFQDRQKQDPVMLSMGRDSDRALLAGGPA
jgi:[acyl-carrier-protein] S-malonyltransferase